MLSPVTAYGVAAGAAEGPETWIVLAAEGRIVLTFQGWEIGMGGRAHFLFVEPLSWE